MSLFLSLLIIFSAQANDLEPLDYKSEINRYMMSETQPRSYAKLNRLINQARQRLLKYKKKLRSDLRAEQAIALKNKSTNKYKTNVYKKYGDKHKALNQYLKKLSDEFTKFTADQKKKLSVILKNHKVVKKKVKKKIESNKRTQLIDFKKIPKGQGIRLKPLSN